MPIGLVGLLSATLFCLGLVGLFERPSLSGKALGLGLMLQMDADSLNQFMGANFPATAQAMQTFPETMGRFQNLVTTFDDNLDNYETLKPVKFTPIIWLFIAGGFLIVIGGGLGFIWKKDEE